MGSNRDSLQRLYRKISQFGERRASKVKNQKGKGKIYETILILILKDNPLRKKKNMICLLKSPIDLFEYTILI